MNAPSRARRAVLKAGGLGGLALSLSEYLRGTAIGRDSSGAQRRTFGRAKQVIMLYLHGGHPQQETFDPKPYGPATVRGEFGAIATRLAGVRFSETLPLTAQIADKLAVVRSMTHSNSNHVTASLPANTGHVHPPGTPERDFPPSATDFPPFGAVLDRLKPSTSDLPTWTRVGPLMRRSNGTTLHGQLPGFLGAKHSSFVVEQKLTGEHVRVEAVQPSIELSAERLRNRRAVLRSIEEQRRSFDAAAEAVDLDDQYRRAFNLLASDRTRKAFDIAAEPDQVRRQYGETEFGQRCLLARRLAEAGMPMVNVSYCHTPSGSWDTHSGNFTKLKSSLAPTLDQSLAALINDLETRGMLDETLVVVNAEFGRTPKINKNAGRDHWPWVYSLVLAGAGIRSGTVYGASDASAAYPVERPHSPADMAATLYHLMGIPADTILHDATGRPHHLVIGRAIEGILQDG